jgi:hypothetical protein
MLRLIFHRLFSIPHFAMPHVQQVFNTSRMMLRTRSSRLISVSSSTNPKAQRIRRAPHVVLRMRSSRPFSVSVSMTVQALRGRRASHEISRMWRAAPSASSLFSRCERSQCRGSRKLRCGGEEDITVVHGRDFTCFWTPRFSGESYLVRTLFSALPRYHHRC